MHLHRVKIPDFRNLQDFEITFSQTSPEADDEKFTGDEKPIFKSHAVIGQNGSGKSNMMEAIITIFRDLDLNNPANLTYEMDYEIRGHFIELKAENGKRPVVVIDGQRSSAKELADNPNTYLPSHVFAYYSGKNQRIEGLFQTHVQQFNKKMRSSGQEFMPAQLLENFSGTEQDAQAISEHNTRTTTRRKNLGKDTLRRLFYCRGGHTQLVLLACLLSKDPVFEQILRDLNIIEFDSALFVLKQPHYLKSNLNEKDILDGDNRFWFAQGTVVSEFLDKLWQVAVAPIDSSENKLIDFRGRREKQEQLFLFVPDKEKLRELGDLVGPPETFFRYAEGAYIGDLIDEIRITVKHKDVSGNITFDQLSEGELQLLTVLGLMRITSQDHCLFLLDEPDTHLNPIWKLRYFDAIEKVIRQDEGEILAGDSQIIITTHDPMMIGSLRREQVRILRKEKGKSIVETPDEHPQGMGVTGLLKSEMFGLRSTIDSETQRRLDRRYYLFALDKQRTQEQDAELSLLSKELSDLGFASDFKDPYFAQFVRKMALHTKFHKETLTPEEQQEQDAIADEIIDEILKEKAKQA
jgi:predicted ATPase